MAEEREQTVIIATRVSVQFADAVYQYARTRRTTVADLIREGLVKVTDVDSGPKTLAVNSRIQKDPLAP